MTAYYQPGQIAACDATYLPCFCSCPRLQRPRRRRRCRDHADDDGDGDAESGDGDGDGEPGNGDARDPEATVYDPMPPEHARHDLWAGVHEATGIWIYTFGAAHFDPPAWSEYVKALYLIKQTIRPYIIDGVKSHPENADPTFIASGYYISQLDKISDHLALPGGAERYTAINLTLFRKGNIGYLIATNSVSPPLNQEFTLQVTLGNPIMMVQVVSGVETRDLSWNNSTLMDAFSGIDGRVYKITFAFFGP